MQAARLRLVFLVLTAALFFGWIGWLAILVWHRPIVLARAPFLVADLNVVASIQEVDDKKVTVNEVVWARDPKFAEGLEGKEVEVTNLAQCRADWRGPGEYLLPLLKTGDNTYEVADATGLSEAEKRERAEKGGIPSRSPGYDPYADHESRTLRRSHIYPRNDETVAQLRQIHPAK
jgi:hypothetical protein